ncbi:hypothetical protein N7492_009692 [Penicillium capsulatum]|uniref:Uncharacterized protein n=1 Tax=Penicillium capsulatum TaxID=69766 RepID=A0A9W9HXK8_9EURO|nr:hypothetical protein N7492_009692 [Penicillium capsulatum]KAJ6107078.1 hypothetical protein N7512_010595 [Penicillium capsulatum]
MGDFLVRQDLVPELLELRQSPLVRIHALVWGALGAVYPVGALGLPGTKSPLQDGHDSKAHVENALHLYQKDRHSTREMPSTGRVLAFGIGTRGAHCITSEKGLGCQQSHS